MVRTQALCISTHDLLLAFGSVHPFLSTKDGHMRGSERIPVLIEKKPFALVDCFKYCVSSLIDTSHLAKAVICIAPCTVPNHDCF